MSEIIKIVSEFASNPVGGYLAGKLFDEAISQVKGIIRSAEEKRNVNDSDYSDRMIYKVLTEGQFTSGNVACEYFGGILSTSAFKREEALPFIDIVTGLSSDQLELHYNIYNKLNNQLVKDVSRIGPMDANGYMNSQHFFWEKESLGEFMQKDISMVHFDLEQLKYKGLIGELTDYPLTGILEGKKVYRICGTSQGAQLYCAAFNKLHSWLQFNKELFGDFTGVKKFEISFREQPEAQQFFEEKAKGNKES